MPSSRKVRDLNSCYQRYILLKTTNVQKMYNKQNAYNKMKYEAAGKRQLGRRTRRSQDTIKMDLQKLMCKGVDWIHLAQKTVHWWAVLNTAMNLRVP
jgi:hypothetical protein